MSGAAKVLFSLSNLTTVVTNVSNGVAFLQGTAERGPFSDASEIITSWPQFVEKYGGLLPDSDTPLLCKRLLEKGGKMRFSRVGHYTDITDPSTLTALKPGAIKVDNLKIQNPIVLSDTVEVSVGLTELGELTGLTEEATAKKIVELVSKLSTTLYIDYHYEEGKLVFTYASNDNVTNNLIISIPGNGVSAIVTEGMIDNGQASSTIFDIKPKYAGEDYNNLVVMVTPGNPNIPNSFNIMVSHKTEPLLKESYMGLVNDGSNTYLNRVMQESSLIEVEYVKSLAAPIPRRVIYFNGGDNGDTPQLSDYIGDSAGGNGLHAFDEYDDSYYLATLDNVDIDIQGVAYCAYRDDMAYIISLTGHTKQTLNIEKNTKGIDDKHAYFVGGGVKVIDPLTSAVKEVKETADVLAAALASDNNYGPWYSFAGPTRGMITNVIGVTNNFGAPMKYRDLDELADNNINMVINRDGATKLWGNFSGQLKNNQERYFNVVKLVFFIKKALRPALETFLEEPNDIPTWQRMYYTVKPLFDELKDRRAIYNYSWQGDQFASSMADLQINKAVDVTQGKYKAVLTIAAINSLQEINVGIVLTDAGIEFEIINN